MHPLLGTSPVTQPCALAGNRTGNPLVCRPMLNPLSYTSQGRNLIFKVLIFQAYSLSLRLSLRYFDYFLWVSNNIWNLFWNGYSTRFPFGTAKFLIIIPIFEKWVLSMVKYNAYFFMHMQVNFRRKQKNWQCINYILFCILVYTCQYFHLLYKFTVFFALYDALSPPKFGRKMGGASYSLNVAYIYIGEILYYLCY